MVDIEEKRGLTESEGSSLLLRDASVETRREFAGRVLVQLSAQLTASLLVSLVPYLYEPYGDYLSGLHIAGYTILGFSFIFIVILTFVSMCTQAHRKYPSNYVFLTLHVLGHAMLYQGWSLMRSYDTGLEFLCGIFGVSAFITGALGIIAFSPSWDFYKFFSFLYTIALGVLALTVGSFVGAFSSANNMSILVGGAFAMVYAAAMVATLKSIIRDQVDKPYGVEDDVAVSVHVFNCLIEFVIRLFNCLLQSRVIG